jgi:hypothetical protein
MGFELLKEDFNKIKKIWIVLFTLSALVALILFFVFTSPKLKCSKWEVAPALCLVYFYDFPMNCAAVYNLTADHGPKDSFLCCNFEPECKAWSR